MPLRLPCRQSPQPSALGAHLGSRGTAAVLRGASSLRSGRPTPRRAGMLCCVRCAVSARPRWSHRSAAATRSCGAASLRWYSRWQREPEGSRPHSCGGRVPRSCRSSIALFPRRKSTCVRQCRGSFPRCLVWRYSSFIAFLRAQRYYFFSQEAIFALSLVPFCWKSLTLQTKMLADSHKNMLFV